jgi:hypothetical protein
MARAVDFHGSNKIIHAPPGREDVSDLHAFMNGASIVSAWELSPDELAEVNRTGRVFMSSRSGTTLYPIFLGSEAEVRRVVADTGPVWVRDVEPRRPKCANPLCSDAATHFPVIRIARVDQMPREPLPYSLEVPKGMCPACQPGFEPERFFAEEARASMAAMLEREGRPAADFDRLHLEWVSVEEPCFAELAGGGAARLWF